MTANRDVGNVSVLLSVPRPRPTTNPYVVQLAESLRSTPGLEVEHFTWRAALFGSYDVFHVHWPEVLPRGSSPLRTVGRHALLASMLVRMRIAGTAVVRTLHNRQPHESVRPVTWLLLRLLDRQTGATISLNRHTPALRSVPNTVIPHGHYVRWFARFPSADPLLGQAVTFGALRRYKGTERLLVAFAGLQDPHVRLNVAGPSNDPGLCAELASMAALDPRVTVNIGFLSDSELVGAVTTAQLVVLPYREMHNSGAALAALSLRRPILVPSNEVTEELATEVGRSWVITYRGDLTSDVLRRALADTEHLEGGPDLAGRDWRGVGDRHAEVYRVAAERELCRRRP